MLNLSSIAGGVSLAQCSYSLELVQKGSSESR